MKGKYRHKSAKVKHFSAAAENPYPLDLYPTQYWPVVEF